MQDPIVIVEALRTPIGGFQGALSRLSAPELGAVALRGVAHLSTIDRSLVTDVIMGCVLTANLGQAPARQAALKAGLSPSVAATTLSKVCGSGMAAVMMAHDSLLYEDQKVILAGGMESMSNAPYLAPSARRGCKFGHQSFVDHLMRDGLEDTNGAGCAMGVLADTVAEQKGITRAEQDRFATLSYERAKQAHQAKAFVPEIIPITVTDTMGEQEIEGDELVLKAKPERFASLKPAFAKEGTVTAGNASALADGAAAMLVMRQSMAQRLNMTVKAIIRAHASHGQDPAEFTLAPIGAIEKVMARAGWQLQDVDLFEINEAFAMVPLAAMGALGLPIEKVNVLGGACTLGHPIGASGARIIVTLINALRSLGRKKGVAAVCIGGGEATAIAIECPESA